MKYRFIYKKWWKILGMLLLLYVFIAGFIVPLRPGILDVDNYELQAGAPYNVNVFSYNTAFNKSDRKLSAYIKLDSVHMTKVPYVMVSDRKSINIRGILPDQLPTSDSRTDATLIIHDSEDGYLILPSAFSISQKSGEINSISDSNWNDEIGIYDQEWSFRFPFQAILYETIRNTFFHVAIWMAMFVLLVISLIYSIRYLRTSELLHDAISSSFAYVAVGLGMLGMVTGSIWAKATWGTYWTDDPKLNMAAISMMIYLAYAILRASMSDVDKRAKVSAAYNIFAFVAMIPLVIIIPRLTDGLHPGNGGNPALGGEDLDSTLRLVFYPAILGYTLLGVWVSSVLFRIRQIEIRKINLQLGN